MIDITAPVIHGIDVSHWQGEINFADVKAGGYPLVYLKATEGTTFVDPRFYENYANAKRSEMLVGAYHFFRPRNPSTAVEQAKHYTDVINGLNLDCLLALDIETNGGLSKEEVTNQCLVFLEEVERITGKPTVVYTYNYFAQTSIDQRLGAYPLWIADYTGKAIVNNPIWNTAIGFQFTDKGVVPGIEGPVDLNCFSEEILISDNVTPQPEPECLALYTIRPGDTLSKLANCFNTTQEELAALNGITLDTVLYVGDKLIVDCSFLEPYDGPVDKPIPIIHVVQPGDTIWTIAEQYGVTMDEIIELNNLEPPYYIYPGDELIVGFK